MNISKNIGYKDYLTYTDSQKYNILIKREEEIERLNNIINELEKWLKEQRNYYYENYYYSDFNAYGNKCDDVLDKLQELKGERINETRHNN